MEAPSSSFTPKIPDSQVISDVNAASEPTEAHQEKAIDTPPAPLPLRVKTLADLDSSKTATSPSSIASKTLSPSKAQKTADDAKTIAKLSNSTFKEDSIHLQMQSPSDEIDNESEGEEDIEDTDQPETHTLSSLSTEHSITTQQESPPILSPSSSVSTSTPSRTSTPSKVKTFFHGFLGKKDKITEDEMKAQASAPLSPSKEMKSKKELKADKNANEAWKKALKEVTPPGKPNSKTEAVITLLKSINFTEQDQKAINENNKLFTASDPGGILWTLQMLKIPSLRKILTIMAVHSEFAYSNKINDLIKLYDGEKLLASSEGDTMALINFIDKADKLGIPAGKLMEFNDATLSGLAKQAQETVLGSLTDQVNVSEIIGLKDNLSIQLKSSDPKEIRTALITIRDKLDEAAGRLYENVFGITQVYNSEAIQAIQIVHNLLKILASSKK